MAENSETVNGRGGRVAHLSSLMRKKRAIASLIQIQTKTKNGR